VISSGVQHRLGGLAARATVPHRRQRRPSPAPSPGSRSSPHHAPPRRVVSCRVVAPSRDPASRPHARSSCDDRSRPALGKHSTDSRGNGRWTTLARRSRSPSGAWSATMASLDTPTRAGRDCISPSSSKRRVAHDGKALIGGGTSWARPLRAVQNAPLVGRSHLPPRVVPAGGRHERGKPRRRNGHPTIPSTDSAVEVIADDGTAAQEPATETVALCVPARDHPRAARHFPSSPAVKSPHACPAAAPTLSRLGSSPCGAR
jgi:hypothetical protein